MDIVHLILTTLCWRERYYKTAQVHAGTVERLPGNIRGVTSHMHTASNCFTHP